MSREPATQAGTMAVGDYFAGIYDFLVANCSSLDWRQVWKKYLKIIFPKEGDKLQE